MDYYEIIKKLPEPLKIPDIRETIKKENKALNNKIIVIDDDATGCQTVHDIFILLDWDIVLLKDTISQNDIFYILTNSRAYSAKKAKLINKDIAENLRSITDVQKLRIISRSDSTLRGHFFPEVETLIKTLGPFDGIIFSPFFYEGGRITINGTHFIINKNELIEVNKTEFSKDPIFKYKHSYLPLWIEEKSKGFWKKEDIILIDINTIRKEGPEKIKKILLDVREKKPVVVDAICYEDLEAFVLGLIEAEKEGKRFLYRTSASFVKIRAGIEDKELIIPEKKNKGLIVVGSYISKTTLQLSKLLEYAKNIVQIELKIKDIIDDSKFHLRKITKDVNNYLSQNKTVVIFTEREYFSKQGISDLKIGEKISKFLGDIIKSLKEFPDFIIAKGGITSFILAKQGLQAEKVKVIGQIYPGIPVWNIENNSKFLDLLYVVFPGNVGDENTLLEIYKKLTS
jgi:uncharacterized protein YgbK (DUF1537 family)